jgi:uncharacterized protein (UPF0179 family)
LGGKNIMALAKEELTERRGRVEESVKGIKDKCGDCKYKKTCLIRNENKTWIVNS